MDSETVPLTAITLVVSGAIAPLPPGSVMAVIAKTATGTAIAAAENSVLRVSIVHRVFCWRIKKVLQQSNVSVQTLGHDFSATCEKHVRWGQSPEECSIFATGSGCIDCTLGTSDGRV